VVSALEFQLPPYRQAVIVGGKCNDTLYRCKRLKQNII
jgi:hypothetical protein